MIEKVADKKLYEKRKKSQQLVENFLRKKPTLEDFLKENVDKIFNEQFEMLKNNELILNEDKGSAQKIMGLLPKFEVSEQLGIKGTLPRQMYERYFNLIISSGQTLEERIDYLESFVQAEDIMSYSISEILGNLTYLYLLNTVVEGFSPAGAGFIFEAWMAAMTLGVQETERSDDVGGTLPIHDYVTGGNTPVSLKLLTPKTNVHGSVSNILSFLAQHPLAEKSERGIVYLVTYKFSDKRLGFYEFDLNHKNIFHITNMFYTTGKGKKKKLKSRMFNKDGIENAIRDYFNQKEPLMEEDKKGDEFYAYKKFFKEIGPALGFDASNLNPKEDEISDNYLSWGSRPKNGNKSDLQGVASLVISPGAQNGWEEFLRLSDSTLTALSNEKVLNLYQSYEDLINKVQALALQKDIKPSNEIQEDAENPQQILNDLKTELEGLLEEISNIAKDRSTLVLDFLRSRSFKDPYSYHRVARAIHKGDYEIEEEDLFTQLEQIWDEDRNVWLSILTSNIVDTQWSVASQWVREYAKRIGTLDFGENWLEDSVTKYSQRLEEMVVPIYQDLADLTEFINMYYVEGKPEAGAEAATTAQNLHKKVNQLS